MDEREARLPKWAQDELATLRRRLSEAEASAEEALLATSPETSLAVVNPWDKIPIGLGSSPYLRVRFFVGPEPSQDLDYIDVGLRNGRLELMGQRPFSVLPGSSNRVEVELRGR